MMEERPQSVKWKNHSTDLSHSLSAFRQREKYTDVTISCGGQLHEAHRILLATASLYFDGLFQSLAGRHPVIVLLDTRNDVFEYILDYLYNGEVSVPESKLPQLIKTAELLQIKGFTSTDKPPDISKAGSRKRTNEASSVVSHSSEPGNSRPKRYHRIQNASSTKSSSLKIAGEEESTRQSNQLLEEGLCTALQSIQDRLHKLRDDSGSSVAMSDSPSQSVESQSTKMLTELSVKTEVEEAEGLIYDDESLNQIKTEEIGDYYFESDSNLDRDSKFPSVSDTEDVSEAGPSGMQEGERPFLFWREKSFKDEENTIIPTDEAVKKRPRIVDHPLRLKAEYNHSLINVSKRRRCRVCAKNGVRRDTKYTCITCEIYICPSCTYDYHHKYEYWKKS